MSANELYNIKLKTGKYDHYDKHALEMLYSDCVVQTMLITKYSEVN